MELKKEQSNENLKYDQLRKNRTGDHIKMEFTSGCMKVKKMKLS